MILLLTLLTSTAQAASCVGYHDDDGDTWGDPADTRVVEDCADLPADYLTRAGDCDDTTNTRSPDATEACDAIDNDCDGQIDEAGCPGDCEIGDLTSHYLLCDDSEPWTTARDNCASWGYTLATLEDATENTSLMALANAQDSGTWWIGLNDRATENTFVWVGGQPVTYTNWGSGEPNNLGNEDCVEVNSGNGRWNDQSCGDNREYICEIPCVPTVWFADADGDGFGDPDAPTSACVPPAEHVRNAADCDDDAPDVHPDAPERCNDVDDDCDGLIDEPERDDLPMVFEDSDGDGFGDSTSYQFLSDCTAAPGWVLESGDCDDDDAAVHPRAPEQCNGLDDDCDGATDEGGCSGTCRNAQFDGDAYLFCRDDVTFAEAEQACTDLGYEQVAIDDADEDAWLHTTAQRLGGGSWWIGYSDVAVEGTWVWQNGSTSTYTNWGDDQPDNWGNNEDCVHLRNDGTWNDLPCGSDEDYLCELPCAERTWFADTDGDGFGDPGATVLACVAPPGYIDRADDCEPTLADTHPGAVEQCNDLDDDCDDTPDDGLDCDTGDSGDSGDTGGESGDSGDTADSGTDDTATDDTATDDTAVPDDTAADTDRGLDTPYQLVGGACACNGGTDGVVTWWLLGGLALLRRRQPRR